MIIPRTRDIGSTISRDTFGTLVAFIPQFIASVDRLNDFGPVFFIRFYHDL